MASKSENDWSDSDDDAISEVETNVLLGVPDGAIETTADIRDAAVSRIGGLPAFLPSHEPSLSSSKCKICQQPMELLVQMWCPVEDSPHDRALYVWACARGSCQKKDGSVRAWRGLRFNEGYAIKLEKKLAKKRAQGKAKVQASAHDAQKAQCATKPNPFSKNTGALNPFGLGAQIFGDIPSKSEQPSEVEDASDACSEASEGESEGSVSSEESLIIAMASASFETSPWASSPAYPPLYLSTVAEYVPPPPRSKLPPGVKLTNPLDDEIGEDGKKANWSFEAYENSLEVDHVFERFTKRVGYEGEQCVRYELKGVPLPFISDEVLDILFPLPAAEPLPVTKAAFKVKPLQKRTFDPARLTPCSFCKSKRVFECQLMPNLINVIRVGDTQKKVTEEERRKAVERALKSSDAPDARGMEWGTCMIFSCENDCCVDDAGEYEARECWREELVIVQWDK